MPPRSRRTPGKIQTHEDAQPYRGMRDFTADMWRAYQGSPPPQEAGAQGVVDAVVNHGRWLVDCPGGCRGAQIVSDQWAYFVCVECGSPENGGQLYRLRFPARRVPMEQLLLRRSDERTRNWKVGETEADLQRENDDHGIARGGG